MWPYLMKACGVVFLAALCSLSFCNTVTGAIDPPASDSPVPIITTLPLLSSYPATPFPTTPPTPAGPVTFSGQVLQGASWETSGPGAGAVVECYCSDDPRVVGRVVASAVADPGGYYAITVAEGCTFYTLALSGDPAADAGSEGGTIISGGRIRYEDPQSGKTLDGNLFRISSGEQVGAATPTGLPVPAGTRYAPFMPFPGALVILGLVAAGVLAVGLKRES